MDDLDRLRATAHPLRLQLLSLLTGAAMSAAEAARAVDRTQANTSYHLRLLERAGLVEVVETVAIRGGRAKRYRHTASSRPFERKEAPTEETAAARSSRAASVQAMTTELERRAAIRVPGDQLFTDAELRLDEADWREVVDLVGRASALAHAAARPAGTVGAVRVAMTAALFQLAEE